MDTKAIEFLRKIKGEVLFRSSLGSDDKQQLVVLLDKMADKFTASINRYVDTGRVSQ